MTLRKTIRRWGDSPRWSDVVVHAGVARWVEVAEDSSGDVASQTRQILGQIDATLSRMAADRTHLLQILIYVADLADTPILNALWDAWVPCGHAPIRACVQVGLAAPYRVEMVIEAAVD